MRFRKRPVEVEAVAYDGTIESVTAICEKFGIARPMFTPGANVLRFGGMQVHPGQLVINDEQGPRPLTWGDTVAAAFEPADEDASRYVAVKEAEAAKAKAEREDAEAKAAEETAARERAEAAEAAKRAEAEAADVARLDAARAEADKATANAAAEADKSAAPGEPWGEPRDPTPPTDPAVNTEEGSTPPA